MHRWGKPLRYVLTDRRPNSVIRLALLACALSTSSMAAVSTVKPPPPPHRAMNVDFTWIKVRGEIEPFNWPHEERWVWIAPSANSLSRRLVSQSRIQLPEGVTLLSAQGGGVRSIVRPHELFIDIDRATANTEVKLSTPQGLQTLTLMIQANSVSTPIVMHPRCEEQGVKVVSASAIQGSSSLAPLFIGVHCREARGGAELDISLPPEREDMSISFPDPADRGAAPPEKEPEKGVWRTIFTGANGGAFRVSTRKARGMTAPLNYIVQIIPRASRWLLSVGLSATYLSYYETPLNIHTSEVGMTAKINAAFKIWEQRLDIATNIFGTLAALPLSMGDQPTARFYGISNRLDIHLPMPPRLRRRGFDLTVSPGWYFWGMLVPGNLYGIKSLTGAQLHFALTAPLANGHPVYTYLKIANISDGPFFGPFSNHEIGAGGGYQISAPAAKHPWTITVDLAEVNFISSFVSNTIQHYSVSAGIQVAY